MPPRHQREIPVARFKPQNRPWIFRLSLAFALLALSSCSGGSHKNTAGAPGTGATAEKLTATHRSGQTFLVWRETSDNARYHVYRHIAPIDKTTLANATRLTDKWGSLGPDTSENKHRSENVPANFIIDDLGTPLSSNSGLFVHTVPADQQGTYYYAVTSVFNSREDTEIIPGINSLSAPVSESSATPRPVLVTSQNGGKGRIYQQYMDYANWNPTLNGYAYDFGVTLPSSYDPAKSYPLQLVLHAYGESYRNLAETEFDWEIIQLRPSDPGQSQNSKHSWWYGYASDHNYKTTNLPPVQGTISNFTEQRLIAAVRFVLANREFNTDSQLTHIVGNSMGASGAVSLGLRYPSVFSGAYASQPMMNYADSPTFQDNFVRLWGAQQSNLPILNGGAESDSINQFSIGQSEETGVWDWMNHLQQIDRRIGADFAYLMIDHGKADTTIDWQTQGQPLSSALTNARVGFSANAFGASGHSWMGFGAVVKPMFGLGFDKLAPWRYPLAHSFPAIHNATGSSSINPGATGDDSYNMTIEWSTEANPFGRKIVDNSNQYEITLRSTVLDQTANITPRRTQSFNPMNGQQCSWTASRVSDGLSVNGNATVSGNGLLTVSNIPIHTGSGTRLVIRC